MKQERREGHTRHVPGDWVWVDWRGADRQLVKVAAVVTRVRWQRGEMIYTCWAMDKGRKKMGVHQLTARRERQYWEQSRDAAINLTVAYDKPEPVPEPAPDMPVSTAELKVGDRVTVYGGHGVIVGFWTRFVDYVGEGRRDRSQGAVIEFDKRPGSRDQFDWSVIKPE